MNIGNRVQLVSFNGTKEPEPECDPSENYWKLIGSTGSVVQDPKESGIYAGFSKQKRVCVKFDCQVKDLGLHCHNRVPNSLWILVTDLDVLISSNSTK